MNSRLQQALSETISGSTDALTVSVRSSARVMGWSRPEAAGLRVYAKDDRLHMKASEEAQKAEFGDGTQPPRPAVRRWANRPKEIERHLIEAANAAFKGVL